MKASDAAVSSSDYPERGLESEFGQVSLKLLFLQYRQNMNPKLSWELSPDAIELDWPPDWDVYSIGLRVHGQGKRTAYYGPWSLMDGSAVSLV